MTRPIRRPSTAVTNSAVESSWTRSMSQPAGTTVRYGSTAKPTTSQATSQAAMSAPAYAEPANGPPLPATKERPTRSPSAAPRSRMMRITGREPSTASPAVVSHPARTQRDVEGLPDGRAR